jgi:predicted alpha/beta hydrolase family esterase
MVERMRFLILHGYEGSGDDHWQTWLAARLRAAGHDVAFPDLPDPSHPRLEPWLDALAALRTDDDVVVCHSLACCLWLHHRARGGAPASRALLVAPPFPEPMVDEIASFFPVPLDPQLATGTRVVCSDDDPYCPRGAVDLFARPLDVPYDLLPDAGHINPETGYSPWPAVEAWAQGENHGIET